MLTWDITDTEDVAQLFVDLYAVDLYVVDLHAVVLEDSGMVALALVVDMASQRVLV